MITAFQVDEFGATAKTSEGRILKSSERPPMSFDYEVLTFTTQEKHRFWQLQRHELTEDEQAEVQRYIDTIEVDGALTEQLAQNQQAKKILASTDWYVIRFLETGVPVPPEITDMRAKARELIDQ